VDIDRGVKVRERIREKVTGQNHVELKREKVIEYDVNKVVNGSHELQEEGEEAEEAEAEEEEEEEGNIGDEEEGDDDYKPRRTQTKSGEKSIEITLEMLNYMKEQVSQITLNCSRFWYDCYFIFSI